MKIVAITAAVCATLAAGQSKPGQCKGPGSSSECEEKYGKGYTCVAVESTAIRGISNLNMCVKGTACSGNKPGACPTFNNWPRNYRQAQSMCVFEPVVNCEKAQDEDGNEIEVRRRLQSSKNKTVTCFKADLEDEYGNKAPVLGIYKCVEQKTVNKRMNQHKLEYPKAVKNLYISALKSCQGELEEKKGQTFTRGLCNGHGTCGPERQYSNTSSCLCNKGYDSKDNCFEPVGNVCTALGQCGALGKCDPKTGKCLCQEGAMGNQCAYCDASSSAACGGSDGGTCVNGKCQCKEEGYIGLECNEREREHEDVTLKPDGSTSSDDDTPAPSSASGVSVALAAGLSAMAITAASLL